MTSMHFKSALFLAHLFVGVSISSVSAAVATSPSPEPSPELSPDGLSTPTISDRIHHNVSNEGFLADVGHEHMEHISSPHEDTMEHTEPHEASVEHNVHGESHPDSMGHGDDHHHGSDGHHHGSIDVSSASLIPSLALTVYEDPVNGWNLELMTENFEFAPERVNGDSVINEGHAHLYINGEKIMRIYSTWHHLPSLESGMNEVTVTLNANGHEELMYQGEPVADTVMISVP